jgi:NAD/NADP transhydrogenase beta subunit
VDLAIQLTVAFLSVIIGMMTFAGSLVAVAKLLPWNHPFHIASKSYTFPGRNAVMIALCLGIVGVCIGVYIVDYPFSCNSVAGFDVLQVTRVLTVHRRTFVCVLICMCVR